MIWSLQTLRFIAAAMVVFVHAAQVAISATGSTGLIPHNIAGLGLCGVDIFFVISGVVITKTAPFLTAQQFAWRRIRRIIPIYYLCCIPALIVALTTGFGWRELLATFLLWPATDVMTVPLLSVAWTLCFEMLFYGCAALVLLDRRWACVLLLLFAASFALRSYGPIFQFLGNPLIAEFLFGVAIARAPALRSGIWLLPIAVAALIAAGLYGLAPTGETIDFLTGPDNLRRVVVIGIPAAMIVYGFMQWQMQPSLWTYLGDTSYTLYLTHTFIITPLLLLWTAFPIQPDLLIGTSVLASVVFAWRVYVRVERPVLERLPRELPSTVSSQRFP
jgi:exopolysaccharide production protein ExoZ